ncbi:MAG: sugar ABC transporter substrate-binding protein [Bacteroidetes bacterium]|nr:sugar ABC transporter substrate-binding protein [Bacteroidota bacterium]
MKKLFILAMLVLCSLSLITAAGGSDESGTTVSSGDPWKAYSGSNINVLGMNLTYIEGLEPLLGDFKEKTGIGVNFDLFNEEIAHQKVKTELASKSGAYDIVWVQANWSIPYAESGWLYPLDSLIENDDVTFEDTLDKDDIIPSLLDLMKYDGKLYGLPFFAATIMTYYRTDILEQYGIDPSQLDTIEGFVDAVKTVHDPEGVAGIAMRGHPGESSWHSTVFIKGLGGTYVEDIKNANYFPTFDTPEMIESTEIYADLLANYSIPGAVNAKYDQVVIAMQQGNVAIAMEGAPLGGRILDPEISLVRGKVGFRVVPGGPGGINPAFTGHGFSINNASKKKEEAWYFLQWSNSFETTKEIALTSNHIAVHRDSLWNDPDFRGKWNLPGEGDFLATFQKSLSYGDPDYRPRINGWSEVNALYGNALQQVMIGEKTAAEAMKETQKSAVDILKRLQFIK